MADWRVKILSHWPGYSRYGRVTLLPIFFIAGALVELWMVKVTISGVNFYTTLKRNIIEDLALKAVLAEVTRQAEEKGRIQD